MNADELSLGPQAVLEPDNPIAGPRQGARWQPQVGDIDGLPALNRYESGFRYPIDGHSIPLLIGQLSRPCPRADLQPANPLTPRVLFGHLKAEHPHLERITDPGELEAELDRLQSPYNTVRLHEGLGYVTPEDEHTGCGPAIRAARQARVAFHRQLRQDSRSPRWLGISTHPHLVHFFRHTSPADSES